MKTKEFERLCNLARIELCESERKKMQKELEDLMRAADKLQGASENEDLLQSFNDSEMLCREDIPKEKENENCCGGYFAVKRIIG